MDFFDTQKQKRHSIRLSIGYAVIGTMLLLATTVLLHLSYGYGLSRDGQLIQKGLVFVSTRPTAADIYLNGERHKDRSNTRLNIPAGQYVLELKRDGYRDWKRALSVEGGKLQRFDYPLLFPVDLRTTNLKQYEAAPVLSTQSVDRRWLMIHAAGQGDSFDLYDLNAREPEAKSLTVPTDVFAAGSTTTGWKAVEWAKDNRHVILQRLFDRQGQAGSEYILVDREDPTASQNLTVAWGFNPTDVKLRDQAYDHYYLHDEQNRQVFTASLREPTPKLFVSGVLAFATERDSVAYATAQDAEEGKVAVRMQQGDGPAVTVRQLPAETAYLLDIATYGGNTYLAAGATSEGRVFLYRDPVGALRRAPDEPVASVQILKVGGVNHVSFSANKRFVVAENGDKFSVYDIETDRGYAYTAPSTPDAPQTHVKWMDGFRLGYVSGGKLLIFDFDGTNAQTLVAANAQYVPAFDRDYRYLYTVNSQNALTTTPLLIPADL